MLFEYTVESCPDFIYDVLVFIYVFMPAELIYRIIKTNTLNNYRRNLSMIKLIASDLDGTLLQNGAQELTPRAIKLVHSLTQKGIHFVAASGRQYDNERRIFDKIKDEISYIAENGSLCIHNGKVISRGIIPDPLARRILEELKKQPGFEIVVSKEDACYIEDNHPQFVNHIVNVMHNTTKIVRDVREVEGPILKIAIANMTSQDLRTYLNHLQEMFASEIKVVTSGHVWIDFIVPDCNKGTALRQLMELFGAAPSECIAFGDQYNDVEMLELTGTSYAMSNAAPGIARHASFVTDSVEDVLEEILSSMS